MRGLARVKQPLPVVYKIFDLVVMHKFDEFRLKSIVGDPVFRMPRACWTVLDKTRPWRVNS